MKIQDFSKAKQEQRKLCMMTCYDYPSARILAESNIDCVLVGDSVAMAMHGHETTIMANVAMMALHTQAVARGLNKQFLICDLPFLSHKGSLEQTISEVKQILQAGAQAIKIEGADSDTCATIDYLVKAGIPVMGHIGLTPQSIHQLGGYKVQGKNQVQAERLMQQAFDLQEAGCFALVIECIPADLAKTITNALDIPTIGIGAGPDTDGQVLVWHDLLGLQDEFNPKFVKQYTQGKALFLAAINQYAAEVNKKQFPQIEHTF